jgi:hypothetical protein
VRQRLGSPLGGPGQESASRDAKPGFSLCPSVVLRDLRGEKQSAKQHGRRMVHTVNGLIQPRLFRTSDHDRGWRTRIAGLFSYPRLS